MNSTLKWMAEAVLPEPLLDPLRQSVRKWRRHVWPVPWFRMRRLKPVGAHFFARGVAVDRYYIEKFLAAHAADIRGHVLEIGDASYTRQFGGNRVTHSDVLHATAGNPEATIVGDLATGTNIPANAFDCMILTQTLTHIYQLSDAVRQTHRALKPGGVALVTVPGITPIARWDFDRWGDYWRFTTMSLHRLFADVFGAEQVKVEAFGNVLIATGFLHNLAVRDFRRHELEYNDPDYQMLLTAYVTKAPSAL